MSELDYFQSLEDYDKIKDFLDIEEDDEDEFKFEDFQVDYDKAIIVDSIPVIPKEKMEKLSSVILKIYSQISKTITLADLVMPFNETTQTTYGFCFIKFQSKEEAEKAVQVTNGFDGLSKTAKLKVCLYSDLNKYQNYPDEYVPPKFPEFRGRPDVTSWLTDEKCRDQYVVRYSSETEISWANLSGEEPTQVYAGAREKEGGRVWCESQVAWSPRGTYLATFHAAGVKLWGGDKFEPHTRFAHADVDALDFSPCENYLLTYRRAERDGAREDEQEERIVLWDVRRGVKIRSFEWRDAIAPGLLVEGVLVEEESAKKEGRKDRVVRGRVNSVDIDSGVVELSQACLLDSYSPLALHPLASSFSLGSASFSTSFSSPAAGCPYLSLAPPSGALPSAGAVKVRANSVRGLAEVNRLRWSADGQLLGRLGSDALSLYCAGQGFRLMDLKSLPARDALLFRFCPADAPLAPAAGKPSATPSNTSSPLLAFWAPSAGNAPALVSLVSCRKRESEASRKLFDAAVGSLAWQGEGKFLSCLSRKPVKRAANAANASAAPSSGSVLLVFHVSAPSLPVDQLELALPAADLAWEPSGDRLCLLFNGGNAGSQAAVYSMSAAPATSGSASSGLGLLYTVKETAPLRALWSPAGRTLCLFSTSPDALQLALWDTDAFLGGGNATGGANANNKRVIERGAAVSFDPSGRLVSVYSQHALPPPAAARDMGRERERARPHPDDGITVFSFQGQLLNQIRKERVYQFEWRPRPKNLLSAEEKRRVQKNLKKYEKQFEKEDRVRRAALDSQDKQHRRALAELFFARLLANREINRALDAERAGEKIEEEDEFVVETRLEEVVVSTKEHIIQ